MTSLKTLSACVLLVAASACASKAPSVGPSDGARAPAPSRNRDLITQQDVAADPALRSQSVLDLIRQLRPHFLSDRGVNTVQDSTAMARGAVVDPEAGKVHVSVDNGRVVPLTELRDIHANEIIEIRFLNAGQAMARFGIAARQGPIIAVKTTVVR